MMNEYSEIMRCERERLDDGGICDEDTRCECPVCGSTYWEYMVNDAKCDIVGCSDCTGKMYPEDFEG